MMKRRLGILVTLFVCGTLTNGFSETILRKKYIVKGLENVPEARTLLYDIAVLDDGCALQREYNSQGKLAAEARYARAKDTSGLPQEWCGGWQVSMFHDEQGRLWYRCCDTQIRTDAAEPSSCEEWAEEGAHFFRNWKKEGVSRVYYNDGTVYQEIPYQADKVEGVIKYYSPVGKLESEVPYYDGDIDGVKKIYYMNGSLEYEVAFRFGIQHGPWKQFYESGELLCEGNYSSGTPRGSEKCYYPSGGLKSIRNYHNGVPAGLQRQYYEGGALREESHIEKHITKTYFQNGRLRSESFKDKGVYREYGEDGAVVLDETTAAGKWSPAD